MLRLLTDSVREIETHAVRSLPEECCGVLIGSRTTNAADVRRVVRAKNITTGDPRCHYQVDWQTLFESLNSSRSDGESIVGFYHSHPDGSSRPSQKDLAEAWVGVSYLIVTIQDPKAGSAIDTPIASSLSSWLQESEEEPFAQEAISISDEHQVIQPSAHNGIGTFDVRRAIHIGGCGPKDKPH